MTSEISKLLEERGRMYNARGNDPWDNFSCAGELADVFDQYDQNPSRAHRHAIRMVLMKVARVATGQPNAENYDDAIGYLMLARKLAGCGSIPITREETSHAQEGQS